MFRVGHTRSITERLSAATRTAVFLMIGGLLAVPYVAVAVWIVQLWHVSAANPLAVPSSLLIGAGLLAVPATLRVMRALERTAANELLGTALEEPAADARLADVARGALWFLAHLVSGALAVAVIVFALPTIVVITIDIISGNTGGLESFTTQLLPGVDVVLAAWLLMAAGVCALALLFAVASQLRVWAVLLLGPSERAKLAIAERHARELARRNGLARELHDSIGHALTATTLQAAAARRLLATDPDKALASMAAVEETGRAALTELDHVLGILRAPAGDDRAEPERDLEPDLEARLQGLVERHGAAGLAADLQLEGEAAIIPDPVAAEAYRMVQEGLTNAAKHAPDSGCRVRLTIAGDGSAGAVALRLENRIPTAAGRQPGREYRLRGAAGGRGLAGLAERAVLLGGTFSAGGDAGLWTMAAELPWGGGIRRDTGTSGGTGTLESTGT